MSHGCRAMRRSVCNARASNGVGPLLRSSIKGTELPPANRPYIDTTRKAIDCDTTLPLRAVLLTQYQRVTDRQTDGQTDEIAIASTALAMRALRCAVTRLIHVYKISFNNTQDTICLIYFLSHMIFKCKVTIKYYF